MHCKLVGCNECISLAHIIACGFMVEKCKWMCVCMRWSTETHQNHIHIAKCIYSNVVPVTNVSVPVPMPFSLRTYQFHICIFLFILFIPFCHCAHNIHKYFFLTEHLPLFSSLIGRTRFLSVSIQFSSVFVFVCVLCAHTCVCVLSIYISHCLSVRSFIRPCVCVCVHCFELCSARRFVLFEPVSVHQVHVMCVSMAMRQCLVYFSYDIFLLLWCVSPLPGSRFNACVLNAAHVSVCVCVCWKRMKFTLGRV